MLFVLCGNAQHLADGTFCGGPFWGLQSIKFLDASQFRLRLLYGNGMAGRGIVRCKESRQFSFVQKRTALHGFCPVKQSFLCIMIFWLPIRSVDFLKENKPTDKKLLMMGCFLGAAVCPPRDCFRRKPARQLPFSFASLL